MEVPEELAKIQKRSPRTVKLGEAQMMISPRMVSDELAAKARREDWDQMNGSGGISIADFEVGALLGKGQFAEVFRCKHRETQKVYAVKTIRKTSYEAPDCEQRIHHTLVERRILSSLEHPYICNMKWAFQDDDFVYFALELVEGGDLMSQYKDGALSRERVQFYSAELVLIIEYLHSRNCIYRDLKPENILLDADGHMKLTDFGLSKIVKSKDKTRTLCGTPHFLPPEMLLNARTTGYDHMVDWWSLGIVIHEMASKLLPFDGGTFQQLSEKIIKDTPVWPQYFEPDLVSLLEGLLCKDPLKRFGNDVNGQIKTHAFYKGIDWEALAKRKVRPPPATADLRVSGPAFFIKPQVDSGGPPPPMPRKNDSMVVPAAAVEQQAPPPVPRKNDSMVVPAANTTDAPPPVPLKNDSMLVPKVAAKSESLFHQLNSKGTPPTSIASTAPLDLDEDSQEDEIDDSD
jgi:serine/threonine protein kinase